MRAVWGWRIWEGEGGHEKEMGLGIIGISTFFDRGWDLGEKVVCCNDRG